jgi:hypothetical protein
VIVFWIAGVKGRLLLGNTGGGLRAIYASERWRIEFRRWRVFDEWSRGGISRAE